MDAKAILAEATKIQSADERQRFVDDACGDNTQLRAEVERLMKADAATEEFSSDQSGIPSGRPANKEIDLSFLSPCSQPDRIGQLAEYEVIEVIGRGGMGIVLRALDTKLNRDVAIKVLAPELAAIPTAVERFLSEAQKAAAVVHDNVVTIHAVDDEHQPPFLVMELIEGETLQNSIHRSGSLSLNVVLDLGLQIAKGLAAAHQRGLTHRDVKPANCLLRVDRLKIADFGLARAADDVKFTQTSGITGTPLYMSPEQARGETVDHRSDLFSLGAVLHEPAAYSSVPWSRAEARSLHTASQCRLSARLGLTR